MKDWVKMVRQTEYNYEFFAQVLSMAAAACDGPQHLTAQWKNFMRRTQVLPIIPRIFFFPLSLEGAKKKNFMRRTEVLPIIYT
jgi:hypothetical protein